MNCPECNQRLIRESFLQGRYVNCTNCGAKLERSVAAIVLAVAAAIGGWFAGSLLMVWLGAPMEVEIAVGLLCVFAFYIAVHVLTLRLKPRQESELKL